MRTKRHGRSCSCDSLPQPSTTLEVLPTSSDIPSCPGSLSARPSSPSSPSCCSGWSSPPRSDASSSASLLDARARAAARLLSSSSLFLSFLSSQPSLWSCFVMTLNPGARMMATSSDILLPFAPCWSLRAAILLASAARLAAAAAASEPVSPSAAKSGSGVCDSPGGGSSAGSASGSGQESSPGCAPHSQPGSPSPRSNGVAPMLPLRFPPAISHNSSAKKLLWSKPCPSCLGGGASHSMHLSRCPF
mmetsp:Transcript_69576/g.203619  ORF Transcript_69576/g.203619 Transcript_69576/m.203619 type:complete len:247 (-) Transcript_69576:1014-1754(-)